MRRTGRHRSSIDWKYILTELVLIVVGILLAINLNTWATNQKIKKQTKSSIVQIKEEIELNIVELSEVVEANGKLSEFFAEITPLSGREINIINCPVDRMNELRKTFSEQFDIEDSTSIGTSDYAYTLGINFELEFGELNDIAWNTAQLSNNVSQYKYDCLKNILAVYGFQKIYVEVQSKFLDYKIRKDLEEFIVTFQLCHKMGVDLLERYTFLKDEIESCD